MADRKADAKIQKLTDLLKQVSEQKQREAVALQAVRSARRSIQERSEFIPKRLKPVTNVQIQL